MPIYATEPSRLQLKLSKSEIQNIQEYVESGKTLLIKINDFMHNDVCTSYYRILNIDIFEEDIMISLESIGQSYSQVYISTLSTPMDEDSDYGGEK